MCSNAIYSIIQTSFLTNPKFLRIVEPRMLLYNFLLRVVEYDKSQSETLIGQKKSTLHNKIFCFLKASIKTGEESFKDKGISEEVLVA